MSKSLAPRNVQSQAMPIRGTTRKEAAMSKNGGDENDSANFCTMSTGTPNHGPVLLAALNHADRASLIALSLHELLDAAGHEALARLAWTIHLEVSHSSDELGAALGLSE